LKQKKQKFKAEDLFPKICSINRRPKETRFAQTVFGSRKPIYGTYFLTGKSPRPIGKKRKNKEEWLFAGGRTKRRAGLPTVGGFTDRRWALALRGEASFCLDFFGYFLWQ
jgi:hypothetical protein